MNKDIEKIELRSEKVRNIIGQIPPWIIRSGTSIIFIIIIILLTGSYFFKYPYTIKSEIIIKKETKIISGVVKIPANEIVHVKPGQKVIISFNNIPKMNNEVLISEVESVSTKLEISEEGAYYLANINLPNGLVTNSGNQIQFTGELKGKVEILTEEISFFHRIIKPIQVLFMKNK